jgi:putative transposase
MSTPIHRTAPGSSYFVTTKCWQGRAIFQVTEIAEIMLETLFEYRERHAYLLHEFVIMPDHLHLLLTPGTNTNLEKAMSLIKGGGSYRIHKARNQKMEIWQEGFHDWTVRDTSDWQAKVQYIRMNPVRARLVDRAEDWPYSSGNSRFTLDSMPSRYAAVASGAKAPSSASLGTPELKLRPPKEEPRAIARVASDAARTANATDAGSTGGAAGAGGAFQNNPVTIVGAAGKPPLRKGL